jgi:hypothetical protein
VFADVTTGLSVGVRPIKQTAASDDVQMVQFLGGDGFTTGALNIYCA